MPAALRFDFIKEIVAHAVRSHPHVADPSEGEILSAAEVVPVTTMLNNSLSSRSLSVQHRFSEKHAGNWRGYKLTDAAKKLADSDDPLRSTVQELIHEKTSEGESMRSTISMAVSPMKGRPGICAHAQINIPRHARLGSDEPFLYN
jgi:hypothetical protein